jgi:cytochrome P450
VAANESAIPATAAESRPFLAGVDDDPEGRRIVGSEHPQPYLHERLLSDPVERVPEGLIIRTMADAQAVTKDRDAPQTPPELGALLEAQGQSMIPITLDGAPHAMWRRVLDPMFTPKKVAGLADAVRARADAYLDTFIEQGEADVYDEWCEPLPSSMFLDIMGIAQEELAPFLHFKSRMLPSAKYMPAFEEMVAASRECDAWFGDEFDRRRAAGEPGGGLIGQLLEAKVEGRVVERAEFLAISKLLMIAGLDTVGGTLACVLAWLARHPDERARLVADPGLWPAAIEELLRWESPVQGQGGYAVADVPLPSGPVLGAGTTAMVYIAAANLDPAVFDDPLEVKLDRSPNPHIAFASGFHRCLGSHLARLELRLSLEQFHRRIPDYRVVDGVELHYWGAVRAPRPLPLVWSS